MIIVHYVGKLPEDRYIRLHNIHRQIGYPLMYQLHQFRGFAAAAQIRPKPKEDQYFSLTEFLQYRNAYNQLLCASDDGKNCCPVSKFLHRSAFGLHTLVAPTVIPITKCQGSCQNRAVKPNSFNIESTILAEWLFGKKTCCSIDAYEDIYTEFRQNNGTSLILTLKGGARTCKCIGDIF
ncbi:hypothetical protein GJ496_000891 [Pomphorhynchus laevis]|nr:hypothetical protein GJ496_000891 [Pomphorhynchus laevis]